MARLTPERLMAQIVHGFLGTEDSRAAGVPAEADVALRLMDDGKESRLPELVVTAGEGESKTAGKRVIELSLGLVYRLRNTEADAPDDVVSLERSTTAQQAHEWMDAVESRLRDQGALGTYLAGLDGAMREGWVIMKWAVLPPIEIPREKDEDFIRLMCGLRVLLAWSARVSA